MEEKRKFYRFYSEVNTKCGVMSRLEPLVSTHTENISGGGMCIPVNKKINEYAILDLELNLPNDFVPVFAIGEVVWLAKDDRRKGGFKAGIEFKAIDDYDRSRIINFISNQKTSF